MIQVKEIREALGFTQGELASIVGVHPITLSKWERGLAEPTSFQFGILAAISRASKSPDAAEGARLLLGSKGPVFALYLLLHAGLGEELEALRREGSGR